MLRDRLLVSLADAKKHDMWMDGAKWRRLSIVFGGLCLLDMALRHLPMLRASSVSMAFSGQQASVLERTYKSKVLILPLSQPAAPYRQKYSGVQVRPTLTTSGGISNVCYKTVPADRNLLS